MYSLKNVHCKDDNLFEKVQIPLLNLKFPQYNSAAKMASNLIACCMYISYIVTLLRANAVNYLYFIGLFNTAVKYQGSA